jgi:hypothetical protein
MLALITTACVIGIRAGFAGSSSDEPPSWIPGDLKRATRKRRRREIVTQAELISLVALRLCGTIFALAEAQRSQSKNKQKTKGSDCFAAELSPPHRIPNKTQTAVFLSAISAPLRENFFG